MEIDNSLVNSKTEENILDDFSDLEPILAEIFSSDHQQSCTAFDALNFQAVDAGLKIEAKQLISYNPSWSSSISGSHQLQETSSKDSSPTPQIISFGNSKLTEKAHNGMSRDSSISMSPKIIKFSSGKEQFVAAANVDDEIMIPKRVPCSTVRSPLQAQDHVMAERKRREKLAQLFIALSKVVPGLKKLDKASLLGDSIEYLQQLQERVRILEEEANKNSITASSVPDPTMVSNFSCSTSESVHAEIKARISNKNVLIKICYKKRKGLMTRIYLEMEKLHLNVLDIRAMPFGTSTLDITVLAEMKSEFCGTVEEIVEHLEIAFSGKGELDLTSS